MIKNLFRLAVFSAIVVSAGCANDVPPTPGLCGGFQCDGDAGDELSGNGNTIDATGQAQDSLTPDAPRDVAQAADDARGDIEESEDRDGNATIGDLRETEDIEAGPALAEPLLRHCVEDAECPVLGTRCVRELLWSHDNNGNALAVASFVRGLSAGMGVCSQDCAAPGSRCERLRSGSPESEWSCQLVAWRDPPHPGAVLGEAVSFPLVDVPSHDELAAGVPFAALCRPDPTSLRNDGLQQLCASCVIDADCGGDGVCVNRAVELGADTAQATSPGFCVPRCENDLDCPSLFACNDDAASGGRCLPLAETCGACLDMDRDGYGIGRCSPQGTAGSVDCDDLRSDIFYAGPFAPPDPDQCEPNLDVNCNGASDEAELVGPGEWGYRHCRRCDDVCDDTVVLAEAGPNGEIACVDDADGQPECGATCASGFADCNGEVADGCETPIDTTVDCGACGNSCQSPDSSVPELVCRGSDDGVSDGGFVCAISFCAEDRLDCDGAFETGCEVDASSDVRNCGACGVDCTGRLANASEQCSSGTCAVDACLGNWADCDSQALNGCETDTEIDQMHCGRCGNACELSNAVSTCANGACEVLRCEAGFDDCDGDASNGCEVDLRTSVEHCGSCSRLCSYPNSNALCRAGRCEQSSCDVGYADCTPLQPGCETPLNAAPNCGTCGETCGAIPANLRECFLSGPSDRTGTCVCDDSATSGQVCNGLSSVCGEDIDEGCPQQLTGIGALRPQQWLKFDPAYPPYTDHSAPATGTFTLYRYLVGFEVTYDDYALIQLQPFWLDSADLEGVGTVTETRNYSHYELAGSPVALGERGAQVIGAESRLIDLPFLATMTPARNVRTGVRLNCDSEPAPSTRAFMLPVAIRLFALDGMDRDISGIQLECQAFEIRMVNSTFRLRDRYEIVPVGPVQLTAMAGQGFVYLGRTPDINFSVYDATPILRLDGDRRSLSFPLVNSVGNVERFGSPIYALRAVVSGPGWGL